MNTIYLDFHKMDRYKLLPLLLNNKNDEIRTLALDFIGALAQNNEYCQKTLIEFKVLPLIYDRLENDASDSVRIKALYAVSCKKKHLKLKFFLLKKLFLILGIIRDFPEGQEEFLKNKGYETLTRVVQVPIEKLQIKACFLIASVCKNDKIKSELKPFAFT